MAAADPSPAPAERPARFRLQLGAWQPFTGGGVAAFGAASVARTVSFQFVFALLTSLAVVWSVRQAWFPPFQVALGQLPAGGAEIRNGRLFWPDTNAVTLGENPQLAVAVDPAGTGELGRSADVQLELHPQALRLDGLFGQQRLPYPPALRVSLDRSGGPAAWGAWNWVGLGFIGGGTFVALFAGWWLSAIGLAPFGWLVAFILRRALTLGGAWRLVAAAWLPATLVLAAGIVLYALNWLRLTGLALATAAHFAVLLLWLAWGIAMLPDRARKKPPENPFNSTSVLKPAATKTPKQTNPFRDAGK